jgi:hypothetical protein
MLGLATVKNSAAFSIFPFAWVAPLAPASVFPCIPSSVSLLDVFLDLEPLMVPTDVLYGASARVVPLALACTCVLEIFFFVVFTGVLAPTLPRAHAMQLEATGCKPISLNLFELAA